VKQAAVQALLIFEVGVLAYFLVLNTIYVLFAIIAFIKLRAHRRRDSSGEFGALMRSEAMPGISIIAPAYNEEPTVVDSIRSLLQLNYPLFEVVLINDGSKDRTLENAVKAFGLMKAQTPASQVIPTQSIRGVYRSPSLPDLTVVDKSNGGKADSLNAGIGLARYPLVCLIDADSLLEPDALTRVAIPFVEDPTTLAVGGIVRIANGCVIDGSRVKEVRLPRQPLAVMQAVEYLRAFLPGRVTQSAYNALAIISGAFGLFLRQPIVDAGGLRTDTIGEDMEIVIRLHRIYRERRQPYRIVFQPDPVCWTEVPETTKVLGRQRNRWQRGTLQVLSFHKKMLFNPRFGALGMLSLPYYLLFEALGPVVELTGYVVTAVAVGLGVVDLYYAKLLFLVAIVYGTINSIAAVLIEEVSFRRYPRLRDVSMLMLAGVIENFGYRQMTTWWRVRGIVDFLRGKQTWGAMTRKGFKQP
jgi:cellulose synthase/poly-beta-1,6-N-acetylglucosamine synthase-like glycosyltransferase